MRTLRALELAMALALSLAACGDGETAPGPRHSGNTDTLQPSSGNPEALVGSWFITANGEEADAILTIGDRVDGGLLLYRECGTLSGDWRANRHAMFVGAFSGGSGHCFDKEADPPPFPDWLTSVTRFGQQGDTELLLSSEGEVVAKLSPGAHPSPQPDSLDEYASPPVVTDEMREHFAEPAPLPDGTTPATAEDVMGRWLPLPKDRPERSSDAAFVAFDSSGTYKGSDGCNGSGGRYVLGEDGLILATTGPTTLIGCDNSPLPSWPARSARLGLRAGHLVFVDTKGQVLGEAIRS